MRFENESDLSRETKAIKIFCEKFKASGHGASINYNLGLLRCYYLWQH